jgi:integrase
VHAVISARPIDAGKPEAGWLFPSGSREGHLNKDTAKDQHAKAIGRANIMAKKNGIKGLAFFQPYVLRHTALTRLASDRESKRVGTNLGTVAEGQNCKAVQVAGAKGGTRTPTVLPARS